MPVGFPVTVEPGTRVLRPVGLSPADRILDDGSLRSRLGLRDQAKAYCGPECQGPVDHGLNILGRSPRLTQGLPQDITSPGLSREAKSSESAKVKAARFGPTSEERTLKPEST